MSIIFLRSGPRWRSGVVAAGFALAFGGLVLCDIAQPSGAVAWAGGVLAAAFLTLKGGWRVATALAGLAVATAAGLAAGIAPGPAAGGAALRVAEAAAAAWLALWVCGPGLRLTGWPRLGRLLALAIAPAVGMTALVAAAAATASGGDFAAAVGAWFYPHLTGMALVLPAALLAARRPRASGVRRSTAERVGLSGLAALAGLAAGLGTSLPVALLALPVLTLVAVRLGAAEAAAGVALVTALGGLRLAPEQAHDLQMLAAAGLITSLTAAFAAAERERLRRLWAGRAAGERRARDRARAAAQAKGDFLATMSHEIRTPMTSIVGFTQMLLRRDDLAEPARRQLALIDRAGASLLTVVNDVLDCAGLAAGEVQLELRPTTPQAVAQDALAMVAEAARRKGLDLGLTVLGPADRPVMLDELRVRQILLNLLGNAVKFTKAGAVRLDLSAVEDGQDLRLRFSVSDTGRGVAPERARRLFERFSQADSSTTRRHGGAGLGLAVSKALVELMGGRIDVRSAPGAGATFWFEIQAGPAPADAGASPPAARPAARVLVVEDHPVNRELILAQLQALGCRVETAADGREALAAARASRYDAILMDVHMPRMDGLAAARAILALPGEAGEAPIIALSADVTPETAERCREAGMVEILAKPAGLEALHAVLARWTGAIADEGSRAA